MEEASRSFDSQRAEEACHGSRSNTDQADQNELHKVTSQVT
jgi:hypothetical protein